ncbi:hypothetical protein [Clostridium manihotivorum]|uniref:Uncharacterized protein n=1 Tax=Clostridium manihotivorum TaxID=2320868 RepID=A0A410DSU4_9CLOT|nr:hypothetical protein [Clostridium manihotivorum]QAA32125.1 hypothetical protein C1I91_10930 [Clostridium manihotivorum]
MKLRINKKKTLGMLFVALIIFSMIFSLATTNSVPLGDIILKRLGLKTWSNGTEGFHYTVLYSIAMLIIGYNGAYHYLHDIYPKFIKRIPLLLVILLLIFPSIQSSIDKTAKSFSKGVNAIDYRKDISYCNFTKDSSGNVVLNTHLQFKNYSNKDVKIYIKLVPDNLGPENSIIKDPVVALDIRSNAPREFLIHAKSLQGLDVQFKTNLQTTTSYQGSAQGLNLIIYDNNQEKSFTTDYQYNLQ